MRFDSVFSQLPADVLQHLIDNPAILRQVLLNHVVPGTWFMDGLEDGQTLTSLAKAPLKITIQSGISFYHKLTDQYGNFDLKDVVRIGDVTVTHDDKIASNGVIHFVNSVLVPPSVEKKMALALAKQRKMLKGKNGD